MNSLCITGYLPEDLGLVESILKQAGLQSALPAQRDASMSISVWHQQVTDVLARNDHTDQDELDAPANLGRLWEQLASDIFISNLHSPLWGWADTRSSPLVSFWKNFDPQLRFVLVVCSPERLIAHAIEGSDDTPKVELLLDQWLTHYQNLLQFHQANSKRSVLVNIQDCIDQPAVFLQTLNKKWRLQLNKVHFPNIVHDEFSDLTRYLAAGLVRASKSHQDLSKKLNSSLTLSPSGTREDVIPSHAELMKWYRKMLGDLAQSEADQFEAQEKQRQLNEKISEERVTRSELSAQTFTLERKQREQTFEIERLHADILRLKNSISDHELEVNRYKEIELKLTQTIKERDAQKSQFDEAVQQRAAVDKNLAESKDALYTTIKERDSQIKIASDLTAKLEESNTKLQTSIGLEKELKEDNDLLLLQLHQVQEELETHFLKNQELSKEVDKTRAESKKAFDKAIKERDALISKFDEAVIQRTAVDKKLAESKAALDKAVKERDAHKAQFDEAVLHRTAVDKKLAESKAALDKTVKERDAHKSQFDEAVIQRTAVDKKLAESKAALDKTIKERDAHKSQFDEAVLQRTAVDEKLAESKAALGKTIKERDAHKSQFDEAVLHRTAVDKKLAEIKAALDKTIKERDAHKSQFDEAVLYSTAVDKKLAESNAALGKTIKERDGQIKIAGDLNAKLKESNAKLQTSAELEKDLKEENNLLLLQLHQVQEELETYFVKYQEVSKEVDASHTRWRRMLIRNPDFCDIESIEIEPVEGDKLHRTNWKIKGMDAGGRHIPEISFSTFIEKGVAGIEFGRDELGNSGFLRWPIALAEEKTLTIAMLGDAKTSEKRALALIGLSTSDWSLLNPLIGLIRNELSNPSRLKALENLDASALIKALDKLEVSLKELPEVMRYDKVKLKREQVNPDYEHLWFSFENMKASGKLIGDFDYRISCANVRPKKFGDHPKLEFPEETCKTVLKSWFDESYDDYGAKLELRFALPESMDMEVWGKLTPHDQMFIRDLVRQLPEVMEDLSFSGYTPKRGWDDWKTMTSETHRVLTMRAEPQKASPTTRKVNSRKSAV